MAADITISPFTTEVVADSVTELSFQAYYIIKPIQIIEGSGQSGGSNRPVSGLVYPRLVG